MHRRINVTLPEETLQLIDRVVEKRGRSRFIDQAVRGYLDAIGRANLRKRLKDGAIRSADRDLRLVEDWFPLEEEVWNSEFGIRNSFLLPRPSPLTPDPSPLTPRPLPSIGRIGII